MRRSLAVRPCRLSLGRRGYHSNAAGFTFGHRILEGETLEKLQRDTARLEQDRLWEFRDRGQVINPHLEYETFMGTSMHPKMTSIAKEALGTEDIELLSTAIFAKYPAGRPDDAKRFVAWHQDLTYWGLNPAIACTCWLAIDDVDVENGSMQFIPGSHTGGEIQQEKQKNPDNILVDGQYIPEDRFDTSEIVNIELSAGECSTHDGWLIHGSTPNRSLTRRRCGYASIYVPKGVELLPLAYDYDWEADADDWRQPLPVF